MANEVPLPPPPPPPPPPPAPNLPKAAYVEEFNEEDQAGRPETRQTANISNRPPELNVANARGGRDEYSDSGYSSHTAATPGSSAPSSLESKAGPNPPKLQDTTAASARNPVGLGTKAKGKSQSPEKSSLRRTQSKAKKETPLETSKHRESKPKTKSKPWSGLLRSTKPSPAKVTQDVPKTEPTRPRATTSQSDHRPRPISVHAGAMPVYMSRPLIVESQPFYPHPQTFPVPYPPPQHSYIPPPQHISAPHQLRTTPFSSSVPQSYPISRQWSHGQRHPSRPRSMYHGASSEPMVEYGEGPIYTTIAPDVRSSSHQPFSRERARVSPEESSVRPKDHHKMLPPSKISITPPAEHRPSVKHAHTTSDAHLPSRNVRKGYEESIRAQVSNRSPTKQSFAEHERSRRLTIGSVKKSDETIPRTHGLERGMSRSSTGSREAKQKHRASVYGHESLGELEGSIQAYQDSHRTAIAPDISPIDTLARRKRAPGSSTDTSSRHSGKSGKSRTSREGSDVKSRRPSSDVKVRDNKDGLAMRFNASQEVNIQMKGGIDAISLKQSKDGEREVELGIGSRGRTVGSRPSVTAREKSRRSYSYIDGQGVTEVERPKTSSRPPRSHSYRDERGMTQLERIRTTSSATENIKEELEPRIIRERITTRSRSRRSSRSGYSNWGRVE